MRARLLTVGKGVTNRETLNEPYMMLGWDWKYWRKLTASIYRFMDQWWTDIPLAGRAWQQRHPYRNETPNTQILASKYYSPLKGTRTPWKRADSKGGTLCVSLSWKHVKDVRDVTKRHRWQLKGAPTGQIRYDLNIKVNNASNKLYCTERNRKSWVHPGIKK